ncbi:MAG: ectoine hydroxylase [Rhodospirillaceae bacterium]
MPDPIVHTVQDYYPSRRAPQPYRQARRDPTVYRAWSPAAPLSREQTDHFEANGYLVLPDLFTADEVGHLQAEAQRLLAPNSGIDSETAILEPGGSDIRSIFRVHRQSTLIAQLSSDERLVGMAHFLLGDDVYIHQSRLNYKPGFRGKEFYWHSDFETWHVEDGMPRMRAISMSVLLAENTAANGPLMLIPKSHRTFISCVGETPADHYKSSLKKQEYGVPDEESLADLVRENEIVTATGTSGTVILFDCNMMHGSNGNITPFPRSNVFLVYNAVSNRLVSPFGAPVARPEFIAARRVEPLPLSAGKMSLDQPLAQTG